MKIENKRREENRNQIHIFWKFVDNICVILNNFLVFCLHDFLVELSTFSSLSWIDFFPLANHEDLGKFDKNKFISCTYMYVLSVWLVHVPHLDPLSSKSVERDEESIGLDNLRVYERVNLKWNIEIVGKFSSCPWLRPRRRVRAAVTWSHNKLCKRDGQKYYTNSTQQERNKFSFSLDPSWIVNEEKWGAKAAAEKKSENPFFFCRFPYRYNNKNSLGLIFALSQAHTRAWISLGSGVESRDAASEKGKWRFCLWDFREKSELLGPKLRGRWYSALLLDSVLGRINMAKIEANDNDSDKIRISNFTLFPSSLHSLLRHRERTLLTQLNWWNFCWVLQPFFLLFLCFCGFTFSSKQFLTWRDALSFTKMFLLMLLRRLKACYEPFELFFLVVLPTPTSLASIDI